MKKTALISILIFVLFSVIFLVQVDTVVKAQSSLDIIYPKNSTYSPSSLAISVHSNGLGASNIYYSMTYSVDGKGNASIPLLTQYNNKLFQVVDVTGSSIIPELPEGPHNVTVYEKIEWPSQTFFNNATVYFTIDDGKPPIITNLSPENKTYSQNNLSLGFTIDEPTSWIDYCLDGQDNVTAAGNITLTDLSYREHNVTIYAQDLAGNIGASKTTTFSVVKPESFPTGTVAAVSGAIAILVTACLLVYLKKHKRHNQ